MPGSQLTRTPIDQLAESLAKEMVPLGRGITYYTTVSTAEEDLREFLHDPVSALPPSVCEAIAPIRLILVPYLVRENGSPVPGVVFEQPSDREKLRSAYITGEGSTLFFAIRGESAPEYHQTFFGTIAHLFGRQLGKAQQDVYNDLLIRELTENVHGEVDEASWDLKQKLRINENGRGVSLRSKPFRVYAAQSLVDTMSLYMHGICCDIDVESGPRYIPSRWLRKRLEALYQMFPPPDGRPVLPEHLSRRR